jgi:hypothetical protein
MRLHACDTVLITAAAGRIGECGDCRGAVHSVTAECGQDWPGGPLAAC